MDRRPPVRPDVVKVAHVMPVTQFLLDWSNEYRAALEAARTDLVEALRRDNGRRPR